MLARPSTNALVLVRSGVVVAARGEAVAPAGTILVAGRPLDVGLFASLAESAGQPFVQLNTGGSGELRLTARGPTEVVTTSLQAPTPEAAHRPPPRTASRTST